MESINKVKQLVNGAHEQACRYFRLYISTLRVLITQDIREIFALLCSRLHLTFNKELYAKGDREVKVKYSAILAVIL